MTKTILIAEDDPVSLHIISAAVDKLGCRSVIAMDGAACLACMNQEPAPDLIVLDLEMPKLNGLQVLSIVRQSKTSEELPIVVLTGKRQSETVKAAIDLGASDYLIKPLTPTSLSERLEAWVRDLDIYDLLKMLNTLRFADPKLLQQPGIQPYAKLGFNAYPATHGTTTLCILLPQNMIPANMARTPEAEILEKVVVLVRRINGWQVVGVKQVTAPRAAAS